MNLLNLLLINTLSRRFVSGGAHKLSWLHILFANLQQLYTNKLDNNVSRKWIQARQYSCLWLWLVWALNNALNWFFLTFSYFSILSSSCCLLQLLFLLLLLLLIPSFCVFPKFVSLIGFCRSCLALIGIIMGHTLWHRHPCSSTNRPLYSGYGQLMIALCWSLFLLLTTFTRPPHLITGLKMAIALSWWGLSCHGNLPQAVLG